MKIQDAPVYIHGVHWLSSLSLVPELPWHKHKRHPKCKSWSKKEGIMVDEGCMAQMDDSLGDYAVPFRWFGLSYRKDGCVADAMASSDPYQFTRFLRQCDVPDNAIPEPSFKTSEVKVFFDFQSLEGYITTLRRFAVSPCPNRIEERNPALDRSNFQKDTDGKRRVVFAGTLAETNLPHFDCGVHYELSVYWIDRVHRCPSANRIVSAEIKLLTPDRVRLPKECLPVALKAQAQFLLGSCQASNTMPVEIPSGSGIKGERYCPRKRGRAVCLDDICKAEALADQVERDWEGYPELRRKTVLAALCYCLGRPVDDNAVGERIRQIMQHVSIRRIPRRYAYSMKPTLAQVRRLRLTRQWQGANCGTHQL